MIERFLNEVFLAESPYSDDIYERKTVTLRLMMNSLIPYNKTFEKRSEIAFILWCADHNVRSVREIKVPECILYTLKHEYRDNVAKNIAYILPYHQERIKYLKKEGHKIVGLMQRMVNALFERSLVEKVFVSPCVSTFGSIATRDRGFYERMEDPAHVADLLAYISATEKVYLVVFDLASLTTDKDDLLNFVGENKNLQGIIVDNIPAKNEYHFFTRYQLLNDPNALNDFERNLAPIKRSK
ncbi:hypothetical protein CU097_002665 [Rhizopus azygosporus]|uniref:Uncharacterized protein n=1 Tax=Rhizopus azygosporus TaxID=86630 RepID=A0A367ITR3_RHIAZ|nr:hypothetical protein CU097_002665 [Rhizopus azygosporus]